MQFIILNIEGKCEEGRCGAKCGCGSTGSNPNGRELDELGTRGRGRVADVAMLCNFIAKASLQLRQSRRCDHRA